MMFGWLRADAARASCSNRRRRSLSFVYDSREKFQRHLAIEPFVLGQVNLTHSATTDERENFVRADGLSRFEFSSVVDLARRRQPGMLAHQ